MPFLNYTMEEGRRLRNWITKHLLFVRDDDAEILFNLYEKLGKGLGYGNVKESQFNGKKKTDKM